MLGGRWLYGWKNGLEVTPGAVELWFSPIPDDRVWLTIVREEAVSDVVSAREAVYLRFAKFIVSTETILVPAWLLPVRLARCARLPACTGATEDEMYLSEPSWSSSEMNCWRCDFSGIPSNQEPICCSLSCEAMIK